MQDEEDMGIRKKELMDASVAGVAHVGYKYTCIVFACKGNVNVLANKKLGKCAKCSMTQRLDKCPQSFTAKMQISVGNDSHTLYAYLPMVKSIIQNENIDQYSKDELKDLLLMADNFNLTYTVNIINSVYRSK